MEELLRTRQRLQPVRLDYRGDEAVAEQLCRLLKLPRTLCYSSASPLDLGVLLRLREALVPRTELFYPRSFPQPPEAIALDRPMLEQIREGDVLLSYPYESMEPFLRLLREAGRDPSVRSLAITLYRVADNSQVVDALCQAALNGKSVLVLVELRARFDEENNIGWSRVLEQAGCRVIYGMRGIKIHSKLCLITAEVEGKPFYYTQIGTGNYNEKTARLYTDLSLMTANQDLGREASAVFERLSAGELVEDCGQLLIAPRCLRKGLCALMDVEIAKAKAGGWGYIGIKCNSVTDRVLMEKLMEASQAGVKVELLVRGICCLVAGVPGYTDNITVVSIVGRYLEHSRLYLFGEGEGQRTYLSSADFMSRNTTRRVEAAVPVLDPAIEGRVREMFRAMMTDNVKGREQCPDGSYHRRSPGSGPSLNAQELFCAQAARGAAPGPRQGPKALASRSAWRVEAGKWSEPESVVLFPTAQSKLSVSL
jgi:polyphosphate kinase